MWVFYWSGSPTLPKVSQNPPQTLPVLHLQRWKCNTNPSHIKLFICSCYSLVSLWVLSPNTKHPTVLSLHFASRRLPYLKANPHYIPIIVLPHLQPPSFPHHPSHLSLFVTQPWCFDMIHSRYNLTHFNHTAKDVNHSPL